MGLYPGGLHIRDILKKNFGSVKKHTIWIKKYKFRSRVSHFCRKIDKRKEFGKKIPERPKDFFPNSFFGEHEITLT